jgi:ribosomal protein S27AE
MVITSPEQEKELHAYSCKTCGSTIFIARHREWFFKGGNTECTNCGAKGTDNFVEIRNDILNSIDDDYFDYESPLDFVSAAERRKLVKQAGGDEELAKKLAIDNVMKNDKEQFIVGNDNPSSSSSSSDEPIKKKKKKKKTKKREEEGEEEVVEESVVATKSKMDQVKLKKEPVDVFDELDML